MNKLTQLGRILSHPRELRLALSGLGVRLSGDSALGSLTDEETAALVRWVSARPNLKTVVEIGTLFGFTARAIARATSAQVVAVDNFCWNPFGLTPAEHEAFARRILEGSGVRLVADDAASFLARRFEEPSSTFVFLDGSHAYADVCREIDLCRAAGVGVLAGHDFGNAAFGVTEAVRARLGEPDEVVGRCWIKQCV